MAELILASSSPRRAELLRQLKLSFQAVSPDVVEHRDAGEPPGEFVARLSRQKADSVAAGLSGNKVVIGADTVVISDRGVLGKPRDRTEAVEMLMSLSARAHRVITGITVAGRGRKGTVNVETIVRFRELNLKECEDYWETGEPRDKAGAYGIQGLGGIFVASIEGSYSNVVGLPVMETACELRKFGIDCLAARDRNFD